MRFFKETVADVASTFAANFQSTMDKMEKEIIMLFSNWRTGANILLEIANTLINYYTRFDNAVGAFCQQQGIDLLPVGKLSHHAKKYQKNLF